MQNQFHDATRIMIADDHPISRKGLTWLLNRTPEFVIVAEASDGYQAVELFGVHKPDICLIDLRMPVMNGVLAIAEIRKCDPQAKTILLASTIREIPIIRAFQAGAYSCMTKNMAPAEMTEILREVALGHHRLPTAISALVASHSLGGNLSKREMDVLRGAARGYSNQLIGEILNLSEHTVKTHFRSILQKLKAADRTQAVVLALQRGYFELEEL